MADGLDFSPLSDDEREAGAQEQAGEASRTPASRHVRPPMREPPKPRGAPVRVAPDPIWRTPTLKAMRPTLPLDQPSGGKDFLPLCRVAG